MKTYLRGLLALLAALALLTAACGSDDDGGSSSDTTGGGAETQDLTLGGPADCETNPFCIPGLQRVYDIDLSDGFIPLEAGVVADALDSGDIDIALLFSTSGVIADKGWVVLEDDQNMLAADNVIPVLTTELNDAYPDLAGVADDVSAGLTTENLTEMNKRFDVDAEDADAIATSFLEDNDLLPEEGDVPDGPTITIGAQDFGESAILAEIYGQAFEAAGYPVEFQELGGFRDIEIPAFESGEINFAPEYAASLLEFLNEGAGEATGDIDETVGLLEPYLADIGLVALAPTDAVDTNTFVVTQETADELGITTISDLKDVVG
ncbi:MAG: hypothetical protein JNK12_15185 [Acidimicrobiales bacterium]|nr:hypothetical protein [Acidimicrobiales bacterium]